MEKHFTNKEKMKYVEMNISKDIKSAVHHFVIDNKERYFRRWTKNNKTFTKQKIFWYARVLIINWTKRYYNTGMKNVESIRRKNNSKNIQESKESIEKRRQDDIQTYMEIVDELLKRKKIKKTEIIEEIQRKKASKDARKIWDLKYLCGLLKVNRTAVYNIKKVKKERIFDFSKIEIKGLCKWILKTFKESDSTIGRDKMYQKYIKTHEKWITNHVFRQHYEHLKIISRAYKRNGNSKPTEKKCKVVWAPDLLKGDFNSPKFGAVLHADIKYLKIFGKWYYLHVILDSFSNKVLGYSIQNTRTSQDTIKLLTWVLKKYNIDPEIFHSDHGIEYANYDFKSLLETKNIKQSMSSKGHSLGNRPSEYFFANIQREKFDFYDFSKLNYLEASRIVEEYINWYNKKRPQSCLQYKTPDEFAKISGVKTKLNQKTCHFLAP